MSQQNTKKKYRHGRRRQVWPTVLLLGGGLLLILGAVFAIFKPFSSKATIEVTGAPSIRVDQEKVDLGNVKLGRTVEVSFQITNVGDETLLFDKLPYIEVLEGC